MTNPTPATAIPVNPVLQSATNAADLAEQQKRLAVALKEKADAERAMAQSDVPKISITPLAGTTTVDANFTIDAQILAHRKMAGLAEEIAKDVANALPDKEARILLMSEDYVPWIDQYRSVISSMESLESAYASAITPATQPEARGLMASPAALGDTLKTAVDFLSLFRSNTDVKGVPVKIEDMALSAELARSLRSKKLKTTYLNPFSGTLLQSGSNDLGDQLSALDKRKAQADQQISALASQTDRTAGEEAALAKLNSLNAQYDLLTSNLYKIDDKTGINQFTQLCKAEKVAALLEATPAPYLLWAKVLTAGGANITKQWLLWSTVYATGGAVISYFLFDTSGETLASGIVSGCSEPKKLK